MAEDDEINKLEMVWTWSNAQVVSWKEMDNLQSKSLDWLWLWEGMHQSSTSELKEKGMVVDALTEVNGDVTGIREGTV